MSLFEICIIDEALEMDKLSQLVPGTLGITAMQGEVKTGISRLGHGTICTAILIEALEKYNILGQVHITHISISDDKTARSYAKLLNSLKYCIEHKPDLVSISVGIYGRTCAAALQNLLLDMSDILVVAAASNTFRLTYPAALPTVLGAKQPPRCSSIQRAKSLGAPDGIELITTISKTFLMEKIKRDYEIDCTNSNSILIPQICAEIIAYSINRGKAPTKSRALTWLANDASTEHNYYYPTIFNVDEEDEVPVVLFPYQSKDSKDVIPKAIQLKGVFERHEYSCSVLSDLFNSSDFIQGLYHINATRAADCISYYKYAVSDSLILVFIKTELVKECPYDLLVTDWESVDVKNLCLQIFQAFPEGEDDEKR